MLALASLTAPVTAAPSEHFSNTDTLLSCDDLENDAGSGFVFVESDNLGSFGELSFTASTAPAETGNPTWVSVTDAVAIGETSVTATFNVVEFAAPPDPDSPFGDPVGTATLEATLTPAGDPEPYEVRSDHQNQKLRRSGVRQDFTVTGTLQLPLGITFDLSSCVAERDAFAEFSNSPASSVFHDSQLVLECNWEVDGTSIFLIADADELEKGANLVVESADALFFGGTDTNMTLTTESFAAALELKQLGDAPGSAPVGSAVASATLVTGGRINESITFPDGKLHITGTSLVADGELAITTPDATYDLPITAESCFGADQRETSHVSPRNNPGARPMLTAN